MMQVSRKDLWWPRRKVPRGYPASLPSRRRACPVTNDKLGV